MSDNDLIRRGDAFAVVKGLRLLEEDIRNLPAVTVGVKPLEWHPDHGCEARGMGLLYAMCETTPGLFAMTNPFHSEVDLPQTEMQAAAQADYEARILAALEPVTQPAPDLSDPVTVHANMLRGTIAKPTVEQIIHLYGVDALAKALASIEYERKVAQMKEDFPNGI